MSDFKKQLFLRIGIGLGGLIIVVIGIFLLSSDISRRVQRIQNQKSELLAKTQIIEVLSSLKKDFEIAKSNLDLLENILSPKEQLIIFPKDLEVLARQNKLDFKFVFGSETPPKDNEPGFLSFTLNVSGGLNDLILFFKNIDKSRYFVRFNSVDLVRKIDSENKNNINIYSTNLSGRVFYR